MNNIYFIMRNIGILIQFCKNITYSYRHNQITASAVSCVAKHTPCKLEAKCRIKLFAMNASGHKFQLLSHPNSYVGS